jgi:signal transduction histidine kinase
MRFISLLRWWPLLPARRVLRARRRSSSRRRIVAASDEARRRIERDLHDGIQQQLVSLGMELGELEASLPADGELEPQVAGVTSGLRVAIDDLREISRGIHPAILSHGGLAPALKTLARRSSVPVTCRARLRRRGDSHHDSCRDESFARRERRTRSSLYAAERGARHPRRKRWETHR